MLNKKDCRQIVKISKRSAAIPKRDAGELHYFEGINETNLVLSAVGVNLLDGGYAGNSLIPDSFLYSREFIPEWKFR